MIALIVSVILNLVHLPLGGVASPSLVSSSLESVTPRQNAVTASPTGDISVTFTQPVDPTTITRESFMIFGRWSGPAIGSFTLQEGNRIVVFSPSRPFSAGEKVTVSISTKLLTPSATALTSGYSWQFWIRSLPGSMVLSESSRLPIRLPGESSQIQSYGAYGGDLNRDGYSDMAVPNEIANDLRVFLNDGTGNYTGMDVYPIANGSRPSPNEGSDFDLDGMIDLAVGNSTNDQLSVFRGIGNGSFHDPVNFGAGMFVRGVAVLDADFDGWPDVVTTNRRGSGNGNVSILLNDGAGGFRAARNFDGRGQSETAIEAADVNEDGILDLVMGALDSEEILIWLGDGQGSFAFRTSFDALGKSWMIGTGDLNGDGHVDITSANSQTNNASVFFGDGHGFFGPGQTYPTGLFPLAMDLGDIDGDGDLDMVTSNFTGDLTEKGSWTIYENMSNGLFGNVRTIPASEAGSCAVLHDRDNNGTLDMTGIDEQSDLLFLFENALVPTSREEENLLPATIHAGAFPNPFSQRLNVDISVPSASSVRVRVFDLLGRQLAELANRWFQPGTHHLAWLRDANSASGSGVYFVVVESQGSTLTRSVAMVGSAR